MNKGRYYVVEYRLPIQVSEASSPKEAASIARRILENKIGVSLSNWFTRVFEYEEGVVGVSNEYFCNPHGTEFRSIDQNVEKHQQNIIEKDSEQRDT